MKNKKNKKRKLKKINIYLLILTIILSFIIIVNNYIIFKYDILPFKYLIIYLIVVDLIPIILIYLTLKKSKKKRLGLKIFLSIVEIIYIIILSFAFSYLNKTFNFLDDITSGYHYQTRDYYVMVLKNSKYNKIADLDNKKLGYVNQIGNNLDKAIQKLEADLTFKYEEYKDYNILFKDLTNNKVDSVLIVASYYDSLLEENDDYEDKFKILYKFSLKEKSENVKKEVDVLKDTFNIYISGIDSYGNVNSLTRSDVNIVVSINPKTNQILMINIPRDYYVTLHDTTSKDKLTHAGIYGIDMSIKTIEDLLDIEINYYFKVNYAALEKLVDALGGVDVYSKYSFTSVGTDKNYVYKKGYNHVNGRQALYFVRTRKAFQDGDRIRGENQQAMIQAIIKKACSSAILTNYTGILESLNGTFITNLSIDNITKLINMQLDKMPSWNITSISLSGTDSEGYTYSYPNQKLYVMEPDEETITEAKENLQAVKDGLKLDDSYQEKSITVNTVTEKKPVLNTNKNNQTSGNSEIKNEFKEESNLKDQEEDLKSSKEEQDTETKDDLENKKEDNLSSENTKNE